MYEVLFMSAWLRSFGAFCKISRSSHSSELISANLYEDFGNHMGIQAITFLGDLEFMKKIHGL